MVVVILMQRFDLLLRVADCIIQGDGEVFIFQPQLARRQCRNQGFLIIIMH